MKLTIGDTCENNYDLVKITKKKRSVGFLSSLKKPLLYFKSA